MNEYDLVMDIFGIRKSEVFLGKFFEVWKLSGVR